MEKIYLDDLNVEMVSVKRQRYTIENGIDINLGPLFSKGYMNSTKGRGEIQSEVPEPYLSAIMVIWGDVPIIDEESK